MTTLKEICGTATYARSIQQRMISNLSKRCGELGETPNPRHSSTPGMPHRKFDDQGKYK
jgi:hypothetical protein